jgi:hypothetical protein
MTELVRIPTLFHRDCTECDCEVPEIVRVTSRHYYIRPDRDERMDELISRAIYYAETIGFDEHCKRTYCASARATLRALHKAGVLNDYQIKLCRQAFGYPAYDMTNSRDRKELGYDTRRS